MYNLLIVDDEPLICRGLQNLLATSGLDIEQIFTASSGHEALDYIRMEEVDLLITDIQMGSMSGIELMQQAKLVKPQLQAIIISAHETFQYAQMAIRLGAKDYLIKPLNSEQFLDTVRSTLLKLEKMQPKLEQFVMNLDEHFSMHDPQPEQAKLLNRLLDNPAAVLQETESGVKDHQAQWTGLEQLKLEGPYFAVIKVKLSREANPQKTLTDRDLQLFRYAALNIVQELLGQEWNFEACYSQDDQISIILQWQEGDDEDSAVHKLNQLEMIGRSLHHNLHTFLHIHAVIGISQILKGLLFLDVLNKQASRATLWNREHRDHYVFYYGDFNWGGYNQEPSDEEMNSQSNQIVEKTKAYIEQNYAQKGLTIHEVAKKNHVSPNYLSYLFKKNTGYNLWEYVIKLRMEESRQLILHTDMRRYEIAEKVGYESPEHFSKIFKKYYGISPSEMKK
ncbi:response regulator [Paenibacillus physcomitrellae]|uniref:Response regulator n=1 Tax=Paenibacillus physcomitrellae TaxID=1619311 RepID=A0ABQ1GTF0_9BACL|nr:response regulator [Paenibacillus physcomitrellae]GGA49970.1 hypothetical protein GCM10010917_39080 [Paenibacillus physcomitrellae]